MKGGLIASETCNSRFQSDRMTYRSVTSACMANFPVRILFLVKSRKTAFGLIAWFTSFRSLCASGWQRSRIEYEKGICRTPRSKRAPFWNFIASMIISLFIPSGGGHWAVQGPFAVPAAAQLHTSQAATAMAVAMGEQVANMIQPFWALPVLAIAGISLRRVMGFTVMSFFVGAIVFGLALLVLA